MTSTQTPDAAPTGMKTFLTIWIGQLVSVIGSNLSRFALGVWIFEQTGKATPFALAALAGSLPAVLLGPIAGALVDRWNRRLVMIAADTGAALATVSAVMLLLTGRLEIWHVYVIALIGSIFSAFQEPAYMASVTLLVPKKDLGRASGMMQAGDAVGQLIAPLLAGLLYVALGLVPIFVIDFVTFLFAVGALILVHIPQPEKSGEATEMRGALFGEVLYGWRYLVARAGLISMLIYFALVNFFANLSAVLSAPLILSFANADGLGIVQTVGGFAMLAGSIVMGMWGGPRRRILGVYGFIALMGVGLMVTGLRPSVPIIAAGFFVMMFAMPLAAGSSQALWQSKVDPAVQGRVFATRSMISRSIMPLAFLLAGPLADRVFEPLMSAENAITNSAIGSVLGMGAGRGVGLIFVISGMFLLLATAAAYAYPRLRLVEDELPDAIPDVPVDVPAQAQEETLSGAPVVA